jgi:hypothetical protein
MVTASDNLTAYPTNGSYGLQQAWRLVFDEQSLKRGDGYLIEKNYPDEVCEMCERSYRSMGLDIKLPRQDWTREQHLELQNRFTREQNGYIMQKFVDLFELSMTHPKTSLAISCVIMTSTLTVSVFFCQYMSGWLRRVL